jgi:hypothetical protein
MLGKELHLKFQQIFNNVESNTHLIGDNKKLMGGEQQKAIKDLQEQHRKSIT